MIPLEDNASDILGKAQRGLNLSDSQLAEKSGIEGARIRQLRDGHYDESDLAAVAPILQLDPGSLIKLAQNKWQPEEIAPLAGLAVFNTPYHDMTVNAYLVWDPATKEAIAFDTGADCREMLARARRESLTIKLILLTHAHPDHVADLARLQNETGAPTYISKREAASGAEGIEEGKRFECGALRIESRLTSGHSAGGMTFFVKGLARPVAVVGDSMFAASMGGGSVSYEDALRNNLEKILTLPNDTVVCPGHGPLTTVAKEKRENPFFAGKVAK